MTTLNLCALTCEEWEALIAVYRTRVVVPAVADDEPITLEEARYHLRIDTYLDDGSPPALVSDDDVWLSTIGIPAARQWAEGYLGRALVTQTLEMVGTAFPSNYFELSIGPVQSIESVTYVDPDTDLDVVLDPADYELNTWEWPNRLQLAYGVDAWPTARDSYNSVRVRYVAGHLPPGGSPATLELPPRVRVGILLMLGHLYENREHTAAVNLTTIPDGARTFLDYDRVRFGFA